MKSDGTDWEHLARQLLAEALFDSLRDTSEHVEALASRLETGDAITDDELNAARTAIKDLQICVEERVAPLSPNGEPYEHAADHIPAKRLRDALAVFEDE